MRSRILPVFLLCLLAHLTGCVAVASKSVVSGEEKPMVRPPHSGQEFPEEAWQTVESLREESIRDKARVWWLGIPFGELEQGANIVGKAGVDDDGTLGLPRMSLTFYPPILFHLGFKDFRLAGDNAGAASLKGSLTRMPLLTRVKVSNHVYERGGTEPTESVWGEFNPFWAASSRSAGRERNLRTTTIPLVYSDMTLRMPRDFDPLQADTNPGEEDASRVFLMTSLMGLGPTQLSVQTSDTRINAFFPLHMAGVLSSDIWISVDVDSPDSKLRFHGPKMIGYMRALDRQKQEEVRFLAWGALWYEVIYWEDEEAARVDTARKGPLWGMFGWGHKDGRPAVHLFWMPVKL